MPLIGNKLKLLAKTILIPLELTAKTSATDAAIHQKMFGSRRPLDLASRNTTLIISNEEMSDIMKIVMSFEKSGFLIKGVSETKMKQKNKNEDFWKCYWAI